MTTELEGLAYLQLNAKVAGGRLYFDNEQMARAAIANIAATLAAHKVSAGDGEALAVLKMAASFLSTNAAGVSAYLAAIQHIAARLAAQPEGDVCDRHVPGYPCPNRDSCRENGCSAVERRDYATVTAHIAAQPVAGSGEVVGWPDFETMVDRMAKHAAVRESRGFRTIEEAIHHQSKWPRLRDEARELLNAALHPQPRRNP